ncbi:iron chelate uptake ABC transporter family permease subunit [Nonomuraea muscovyensis]|uniref:iron chelate uptake ABC transporter family permease subunit n=1 Tax=Nonomuraea muscovyensis TaxID=1124761 RepID=UPI0033E71893
MKTHDQHRTPHPYPATRHFPNRTPGNGTPARPLWRAALLLGRWTRAPQLGDEVATVLGTPVRRARLVRLLTGVVLVASGTSAAGPVAFVALAAPRIARRLARTAWPPPLVSALAGSFLVLASDLAARRLIPDVELPVGVVTGVLGAPLLLWLLARSRPPR